MGLGTWINAQRASYRKGILNTERQKRLAALPGWVWNARETRWDENLEAVKRYVASHGQLPPRGYEERGVDLGNWIQTQRLEAKKGRLGEDRKTRLETEIPGWSWDPHEASWDAAYEALRTYTKREGHARPRYEHVENGIALGRWVNKQRMAYKRGQLRKDRIARLEALKGWVWEATHVERRL